ncbi:MAG: TraM recognition domain-containing protein [Eggerthellaceae bacterium]|nr:TraM recognition domain-containing protein [Eggerthellaceae bacterium]
MKENPTRRDQFWNADEGSGPHGGLSSDCPWTAEGTCEAQIFSGRCNLSFGVTLGTHHESGSEVFQFNEDRFRHTIILGRTGAGKSNHIQQMEREDIRNGAGVFILAAHEDDALYPLCCVPEERLGDVVFIDASNPEYLPRMNPLDIDTSDRGAVDKAVNDVLELLTMDSEHGWAGPRYEQYLRNGLGLLLARPESGERSITELYRLFTEPECVKGLLKYCTDESVYDYWTKVFPDSTKSSDHGEVVDWFLAKVSRFANDHTLRHMFGAGKSTIDMRSVVDEGRIFIAYVPESRIGSIAARTVSKWLVMQLRDAIMSRRSNAGSWQGLNYGIYEGRPASKTGSGLDPFFVYVDEFAKFATTDFETLLAEARKQNVGFVLSTQTLSQTLVYDKKAGHTTGKLEEAILGNVGSTICYPVGLHDAELLSRQFDVDVEKLKRIERYRPLSRICADNQIARPGTLEVGIRPAPDNPTAARRVAKNQVLSGAWVEVEDAPNKGAFLRMVSGAGAGTASRRPAGSGHASRARKRAPKTASHGKGPFSRRHGDEDGGHAPKPEGASGQIGASVEGFDRDSAIRTRRDLVDSLETEYAACLPEDWRATLRDSLGQGFDDAMEALRLRPDEVTRGRAEQHMRAHAALVVADFIEASLPKCPPVNDFCFLVRRAARSGLGYARGHAGWEGFEITLGTMPEGVIGAWAWINHPANLREAEEMAIHDAGGSCSSVFAD